MVRRAAEGHRSRPDGGPGRFRGRPARVWAAVLGVLVLASCGAPAKAAPALTALRSARAPEISVAGSTDAVPYSAPVQLKVAHGTFAAVTVSSDRGDDLNGAVSADGLDWVSREAPRPDRTYQGVAKVKDVKGADRTVNVTFKVSAVPNNSRLSFTVTPQSGSTVGVGQPVVVRFASTVTERAAIEKVMQVRASTPDGTAVTGSWHWLNGRELHWRPKEFWTPGTTVSLTMRIAGVKAAKGVYGRKDYDQTFTIGSSQITKVDGVTHQVQVYRDGELVHTWPGGTGKPGLETYSGTYVVLGKTKEIVMDSCSAKITCDEEDPDYYSETEYWATRVTASGTFLHAASWDPLLGKANVSHGCIHLSDTDAEKFYNDAVIGDVVIVANTGRGPEERIATQDPGLYDWNLSWEKWTAGSALS
ncbi:MAG: Ig-like domain-containing protein [Kineosporiaceae bacterium]